MKKTWKHSWAAAILGATALVTTSNSHAAAVVYFEQVGADVVATWTGSVDPGALLVANVYSVGSGSPGGTGLADSDGLQWANAELQDVYRTGVASLTTLTGTTTGGTGFGSFGFNGQAFVATSISPGADYDSVTPMDFDSATVTITFASQTLAGIGADSFSDTLAWTSSTGDTIRYTTGSPVPEPASGLLCGVGLLGALLHRRRR